MDLKAHTLSGFVLRTNLIECPMSGPKETHLSHKNKRVAKVGHPVLLVGDSSGKYGESRGISKDLEFRVNGYFLTF